jgi:hypothetical protein
MAIIVLRYKNRFVKYKRIPADSNNWSPSPLADEFYNIWRSWFDTYENATFMLLALDDRQFIEVHNDFNKRYQREVGKDLKTLILDSWFNSALPRYRERIKILNM